MKKCFITQAKEKLNLHKVNGIQSDLSVYEVAHLFDVITGKSNADATNLNAKIMQNICLN